VFQHGADLIQRDSGEPLHELASLSAVFEVLEERGYRNASTAKYPAAAHETGTPFDSLASWPVDHGTNVNIVPENLSTPDDLSQSEKKSVSVFNLAGTKPCEWH
jgi:hypothetical protein